ncbi:hypothetical protein SAMN02745119_00589 [Trichlorobacter thiogenes]|uniref:Uncharacterized protein n=1 Tax=Trichlorobacter thiogenes TaxID=115783 RepID=A0A1T4KJF6_9BACT|nr:hypothetical protein SAMN02745119_00589 [Trichlorobacter thiogenes]
MSLSSNKIDSLCTILEQASLEDLYLIKDQIDDLIEIQSQERDY